MANTPKPQMLEGQSTHRPPLFIGSDYGYWKNRMIMYMLQMQEAGALQK
jgi:hypothetical protein